MVVAILQLCLGRGQLRERGHKLTKLGVILFSGHFLRLERLYLVAGLLGLCLECSAIALPLQRDRARECERERESERERERARESEKERERASERERAREREIRPSAPFRSGNTYFEGLRILILKVWKRLFLKETRKPRGGRAIHVARNSAARQDA